MAAEICLKFETVSGVDIDMHSRHLGRLRIAVFREWPYLYEGDAAYEEAYVRRYAQSSGARIILAHDGDEIVGAASAMPLVDEYEAFRAPFEQQGIDPDQVYYFGESVLMPAYRGLGAGHAFFDAREAAAREQGFPITAFCAVVRDKDDPRKPAGARALEPFWRGRGYEPVDGLIAHFSWQETGDSEETEKPMQFWLRGATA